MLYFEKLRWKNFLSTGNVYTEIQLDRSPSTVVVGENGAGKSTMLDALTFVLFNKPFRNIKKGQLISSVNKKDSVVEVEFRIGSNQYLVRRGQKPSLFEIHKNGQLVDQPGASKDYQSILEDTILKLNYKSFTQVVILGSATFTPFMQLSTNDRRTVIEDLLDIQIFSNMNTLLKDRVAKNKSDRLDCENQIELLKDKIEVQEEYLKKLQEQTDKQIKELDDEIQDWSLQIISSTSQAQEHYEEIHKLQESMADFGKVTKKSQKVSELLMKLHDKIASTEKRLRFYQSNNHCPTCEQIIEAHTKSCAIEKNEKTIDETSFGIEQLKQEQEKLNEQLAAFTEIQNSINGLQTHINNINTSIANYEDNISRCKAKKEQLLVPNDAEEEVESPSEKISNFQGEVASLETKAEQLSNDAEVFKYATNMLKDGGIKTKIIRQYVPIINKLVNKYLAALDFFVNFELDEEFNEVIKSRGRDDFSYASFSEGEKARIDISLMLTWRAVAKLKNSVNTNLLILDEVFDGSVDTNGTEILMGLFNELHDTNIFVISHKGDQMIDKFRSQIKFEKVKSFSRIAA
jgi:DNA repair exonuclease SbcCD ATPase subunit